MIVKEWELSTRDRVAVAIYNEIIEGRGTKSGGVFLDISYKEKEFIVRQIPEIYKKFWNIKILIFQNILWR